MALLYPPSNIKFPQTLEYGKTVANTMAEKTYFSFTNFAFEALDAMLYRKMDISDVIVALDLNSTNPD